MQEVTVAEVRGQLLVLKEPLMHSIQPDWNPRLTTTHYLERVGIEHLRIDFPEDEYAGHHKEAGYNGMFLTDLLHSWVRDVTFVNADSGILSENSKNVTVQGVRTEGRRGHYSVHLGKTYGMLVRDFAFKAKAIHNPSFNTQARRGVYTGGEVHHARLDQHNGYNHQNLFNDLRVHLNPRWNLFRHGGDYHTRPTAGAFNTFWNIHVQLPNGSDSAEVGFVKNAPQARIVGLHGTRPITISYEPDLYTERLNRGGIAVPSLYEYQLREREKLAEHPSIFMLAPSEIVRARKQESVRLEAVSSPSRVGVRRVEFYANGARVGTARRGSRIGSDRRGHRVWETTWTNLPPGISQVRAVAVLESGDRVATASPSCGADPSGVWTGSIETLAEPPAPSPSRSHTTITYTLPSSQHVQLTLFDVQGRKVQTTVDEFQVAGERRVTINTSSLASGVYFYRLRFSGKSLTGKIPVVH